MTRSLAIAVVMTLLVGSRGNATLVFDGIIDSVTFSRTPIGGGLDSIVVTVAIGGDTFDTLDGGFVPVGVAMFNQNNFLGTPDATPPAAAFTASMVPSDDTTFLLPRDFGDPDFDGTNTDTSSQLSSLSISYTTPLISGTFDLARLVVPTGADVEVIGGGTIAGSIPLILGGMVKGKISGSTAVPEATVVVAWLMVAGGVAIFRYCHHLHRGGIGRGET